MQVRMSHMDHIYETYEAFFFSFFSFWSLTVQVFTHFYYTTNGGQGVLRKLTQNSLTQKKLNHRGLKQRVNKYKCE